jgi:microcystin-dependent protein
MLDPYIGQISVFAFSLIPRGWAVCNGQLLAISSNTKLFSLIGTTYGGNGTSNFGLPDLQGRAPLGFGAAPSRLPYALGQSGGVETNVLWENTMPAHTHALLVSGSNGTTNTPSKDVLVAAPWTGLSDPTGGAIYNPAPPDQTLCDLVIGPAGSTTSNPRRDNMQPSQVLRYCIATDGIFPPAP